MDRISWKSTFGLALAAMVCLMAAPASAGITYNVTNYAAGQNDWSLAGTITVSAAGTYTDNVSAITAWNITATKGSTSHVYANNAGVSPLAELFGTLNATSSKLLLNTNGSFAIYSKSTPTYSGLAWSNAVDYGMGPPSSSYYANILGSNLWNTGAFSPVDGDAWVLGTTGSAAVPEIDPAGIGSVLALVTGALGLLERRRLKVA
jgi:hypothetical protein